MCPFSTGLKSRPEGVWVQGTSSLIRGRAHPSLGPVCWPHTPAGLTPPGPTLTERSLCEWPLSGRRGVAPSPSPHLPLHRLYPAPGPTNQAPTKAPTQARGRHPTRAGCSRVCPHGPTGHRAHRVPATIRITLRLRVTVSQGQASSWPSREHWPLKPLPHPREGAGLPRARRREGGRGKTC